MKTSASKPPVVAANVEAERCVLGAIITDDDLLPDVIASGLKPADFLISAHRRIFEAATRLRERNTPVDIRTVADALGNLPELFALLTDAMYGVVVEKRHILYQARLIREKASLRRIQKFGEWLTASAGESIDPNSLLVQARQKLDGYSEAHAG